MCFYYCRLDVCAVSNTINPMNLSINRDNLKKNRYQPIHLKTFMDHQKVQKYIFKVNRNDRLLVGMIAKAIKTRIMCDITFPWLDSFGKKHEVRAYDRVDPDPIFWSIFDGMERIIIFVSNIWYATSAIRINPIDPHLLPHGYEDFIESLKVYGTTLEEPAVLSATPRLSSVCINVEEGPKREIMAHIRDVCVYYCWKQNVFIAYSDNMHVDAYLLGLSEHSSQMREYFMRTTYSFDDDTVTVFDPEDIRLEPYDITAAQFARANQSTFLPKPHIPSTFEIYQFHQFRHRPFIYTDLQMITPNSRINFEVTFNNLNLMRGTVDVIGNWIDNGVLYKQDYDVVSLGDEDEPRKTNV